MKEKRRQNHLIKYLLQRIENYFIGLKLHSITSQDLNSHFIPYQYNSLQSKKEKVVKNKKEVKKKKVEETNSSEDDNSGRVKLIDDENTE